MSSRPCHRLRGRIAEGLLALVAALGLVSAAPAAPPAAPPVPAAPPTVRAVAPAILPAAAPAAAPVASAASVGAIGEMPADTAFYSAMLRNRERIEAIAHSKAWGRLMALPLVETARSSLNDLYERVINESQQAEALVEWARKDENAALMAILADLLSDEVYVVGGKGWVDTAELTTQVLAVTRVGNVGVTDPQEQQKKLGHAMLKALAANLPLIQAPDLVVGFKLRDVEAAKKQFKRLPDLLDASGHPYKKVKLAGNDFYTMVFDTSTLPLDQLPLEALEEKEGEFKALRKKLEGLQATLSIGIRNGYLVVAIGPSTDFLLKLGDGKKLIDLPEAAPLAKAGAQRFTSISYLSKAMARYLTGNKNDLDTYVQMLDQALTATPLEEKDRARIKRDMARMVEDLKAQVPEPAAMLAWSALTERGSESFDYSFTAAKDQPTAKPLTLLDQVGGNPLLAVVGRGQTTPVGYGRFAKWVEVALDYFEELGLPQIDEEPRGKIETVMKAVRPLLKRFHTVTEKMFLPALADGQSAFVLDARLTSKQWQASLPASTKPLPVLEPAIVLGVSDAPLFEKAFGEYNTLAKDLAAALRKIDEDTFTFEVAAPEKQKLELGNGYFYRLPASLGLDKRLVPNVGVSPTVAVLTLSQEHTERLLMSMPLKQATGPLADLKRPLLGASHVRWSGFVDVVEQWGDYGFRVLGPYAVLFGGVQQDQVTQAQKTTKAVWDVLRITDSTSSATYIEGGAVVTHSETVYQDK